MTACPNCATERVGLAKFCGECAHPFDAPAMNVSVGRDNSGVIVQGSPGTIIHPPAGAPRTIGLEARWRWNSPLTQSALAWIGKLLSLASLVPLAKVAEPLVGLLQGSAADPVKYGSQGLWAIGFGVAFVLAMMSFRAAGIVRRRQVRPLDRFGLLPAIWGREGTLGLARLNGTCPSCDGALTLKNVATAFTIDQQGKERPTRWEPFAVCKANPEQHRFPFDMTTAAQDGA